MLRSPLPDGHSNGTLHVPDGDGPWPGVLVFPAAATRTLPPDIAFVTGRDASSENGSAE
jgi:hypothetical protein